MKLSGQSEAWRFLFLLVCTAVVASCTNTRTVEVKDGYPDRELNVAHIPDAVPKPEPRTRAGNSNPYTVLGKTYYLENETAGFRQKGHASWYGTKFHGLRTANGEIYDMYGMTAAHKTLPIPSYVKVTNLDNGRSVVVRINDRGPFHGGRIIDLTYTAAKKLGFVAQGTAPVEVEYIDPLQSQPAGQTATREPVVQPSVSDPTVDEATAPTPKDSAGYAIPKDTFLQVGAFSSESSALNLQKRLIALTDYPVVLKTVALDNLVRVQIGPLKNNLDLVQLRQLLVDRNIAEPHVIYE